MYREDRPAFVQIVEEPTPPTINGYTLQIDIVDRSASIIILEKGGNKSMLKTVERVKAGWEKIYEDVIAFEKEVEEKIRQQMAKELESIKSMKAECIETVEVEVPDEVDVAEDSEAVEDAEVSEEVTENGISF